jgi:hypothetical protein
LGAVTLLYSRLQLSMDKVIKLVEEDNRINGFYNPKKDIIIESDSICEFKEFQALIKGLNNIIYYNSLLLSGYSIFEYSLKSICFFISEHFLNYKLFEDEQRDILGNCIKYLKGTDLINFKGKEIDKYYVQIKRVSKLRNIIAHYNGNIFKDKTKSLKNQKHYILFSSDKRLSIMQNGQIYIDDSDYIISFIQDSEKFLIRVIEEIKN